MDSKTKKTIFEMSVGICLYMVILEIIGLVLMKGPDTGVIMGILLGSLMAMVMAIHMGNSIEISLDMGENGAMRKMVTSSLLRRVCVLAVFIGAYFSGWFNMLAVFFGLMGLKCGAYVQPAVHRVFGHNEDKENASL